MNLKEYISEKEFLKALTTKPGVYRMLDEKDQVIYVGKASNLKNRVSSYFGHGSSQGAKTRALMQHMHNIEVSVTRTQAEALILENNLIKQHLPRYNILLRDDKSYPYIYLSSDQEYPRLSFHRGARKGKGKYFGPFPNAGAVRRTLNLLQKLFLIRSCEDSMFQNRSRPCLQYQIKRCTAPCVGQIDQKEYLQDIEHAVMFLEGKNEEVIEALYEPMQKASETLEFERAAHYRDQISNLRKVQEHHLISDIKGNIDFVACVQKETHACIHVSFLRSGMNMGSRDYFPRHTKHSDISEILTAFITQYYLAEGKGERVPQEILINEPLNDQETLEAILSDQQGRKVQIRKVIRGEKLKWMKMAASNAVLALNSRLASHDNQAKRLQQFKDSFQLIETPERIECFDISHTQGNETVASCVVYDQQGLMKSDYRRFNISGITGGDDYAAMEQVLTRRYTRVQKEEGKLPDVILIDGGKGQVTRAKQVMQELQLQDIIIIGVSKGPERRAGQEKLIVVQEAKTMQLTADSPALHLIQNIRDEAHRFAISGHRERRKKQAVSSPLESIEGVGAKRRQKLLQHFGGLRGVEQAGVEDLSLVPGINKQLAQKIYDTLHES